MGLARESGGVVGDIKRRVTGKAVTGVGEGGDRWSAWRTSISVWKGINCVSQLSCFFAPFPRKQTAG
uniref:Uncharacterized protein n=1 Tax=Vitis vinifera TaxID=29760 RepID=F6HUW3_VITVI